MPENSIAYKHFMVHDNKPASKQVAGKVWYPQNISLEIPKGEAIHRDLLFKFLVCKKQKTIGNIKDLFMIAIVKKV